MEWETITRPKKNPRRRPTEEDMHWDRELEKALLRTLGTNRALVLPLWQFHCSPAKGRLWAKGYDVRHRVLDDKKRVAAWVERTPEDKPRKSKLKSNARTEKAAERTLY